MSQGTKQFPTRIPVALHAALAAAATENNRSLNAEVIYRLDQTFQENPDCPPVEIDLLVTAAANAVATVFTEVITTCFTKLEERILQKLAPEMFITSVHIDTSDISDADLAEMLKSSHYPGYEFPLRRGTTSPTGRLSESQPEISGLNTLPQAMRKRDCMCGGGVAGFHIGGYVNRVSLGLEEAPAILSQGVNSMERLPLEGQTWVITGSLETTSRDSAREKLIRLGARVSGSVDNSTDALLHGPGAGSKKDKAVRIGVPLWDEAEFVKLVDSYQHLTIPGALDWDNPDDGWTENTGSMPVQPRTLVKWRVRGGFGNTPEDVQGPEPASAIDWTLEDEPDAFDIMSWRLA